MKNNKFVFLIISISTIFIALLFNYIINMDSLVYNFYSEQLAQEQLDKLIKSQEKWQWLGYAIIPLLILIRTSLVALTLSVGNFFYTIDSEDTAYEQPKFKSFFRIALLGDFVYNV